MYDLKHNYKFKDYIPHVLNLKSQQLFIMYFRTLMHQYCFVSVYPPSETQRLFSLIKTRFGLIRPSSLKMTVKQF
jgi:hypothetical protein